MTAAHLAPVSCRVAEASAAGLMRVHGLQISRGAGGGPDVCRGYSAAQASAAGPMYVHELQSS